MRDMEDEFWTTWRMRLVPRLVTVVTVPLVWLLFDAAWAASPLGNITPLAKRDTVWLTPKLGPGGESARLVAADCHFDLRHRALSWADSLGIYDSRRTMDKGTMSCTHWLTNNGETVP
jgi:hypothetical protein